MISVVGRFLEHSRIYYDRNGGEEEYVNGSADLMTRNLKRRVETLVPVQDRKIVARLKDEILWASQRDNLQARLMDRHGGYVRAEPREGQKGIACQEWLYRQRNRSS